MLSLKSVASALLLAASFADLATPVLVVPAVALGVAIVVHGASPAAAPGLPILLSQASQPNSVG